MRQKHGRMLGASLNLHPWERSILEAMTLQIASSNIEHCIFRIQKLAGTGFPSSNPPVLIGGCWRRQDLNTGWTLSSTRIMREVHCGGFQFRNRYLKYPALFICVSLFCCYTLYMEKLRMLRRGWRTSFSSSPGAAHIVCYVRRASDWKLRH